MCFSNCSIWIKYLKSIKDFKHIPIPKSGWTDVVEQKFLEMFKSWGKDGVNGGVGPISLQDWNEVGVRPDENGDFGDFQEWRFKKEKAFIQMDANKVPFVLTGCYLRFLLDCVLSVGCRVSPINTDVSSFLSFYIRTVRSRSRR